MPLIERYIESLCHAEQERLLHLLKDLRLCESSGKKFRFLDMGAGSGTMSVGVLLLMENAEGTLVDIQDRFDVSDEMAEILADRYRFIEWKNLPDLRDQKFNLVISTDVLEHIPDWRQAFQDLCGFMDVGGYLYVQVPSNYPSPNYPLTEVLKHRFYGLFGRNDPNQHVRHGLSCKQLFDEGLKAGLKPLVAAEDYVINSVVHCDFKPRCHCLFMK